MRHGVFMWKRCVSGCVLVGLAWSGLAVAQEKPAPKPNPMDLSRGEPASDFVDALASGTVKIDLRARAEIADQRGLDTAQSYTLRSRLGYLTQKYEGWQFFGEFEDVRSADDDRYNSTLNGATGVTVVADPEVTELNQLWVSYDLPLEGIKATLKPGRQAIKLDDERFVGDVGWRQDSQTFDAFTATSDLGVEKLSATYSYLWQINRIFAEEADFDSTSHLLNVSYQIDNVGKLTGFAYLLDFDNSAANSSQTYGGRFEGKKPVNETVSIEYAASVAMQSDYGDNPNSYDALYYMADVGAAFKDLGTFGAGYEVLGSDNGDFAFRTPLATLHKFNGFADVFLVTPNDGLQDLYVYFKPANLPWGLKGMVAYHYFAGDDSIGKFGDELDAVLSKKLSDNLSVSAKYAYFLTDQPGFAERSKLTVDLTLAF